MICRDVKIERAPDFLGIGVQKAGTTWLHVNLKGHPEVWLPPIKELHFFDELHTPWARNWTPGLRLAAMARKGTRATHPALAELLGRPAAGDAWYREIFAAAAGARICGEVCPTYSGIPESGRRHAVALNPRLKLVLMLRDPVERAWSHAKMVQRGPKYQAESIETILEYPWLVEEGYYLETLDRWLDLVGPERLLVEFLDHVRADPLGVLARVCRFLGIGFEGVAFPRARAVENATEALALPGHLRARLEARYRTTIEGMRRRYPDPCAAWSTGA